MTRAEARRVFEEAGPYPDQASWTSILKAQVFLGALSASILIATGIGWLVIPS